MDNSEAMPAFLVWSIVGFFAVIVVIAVLVTRTFSRYHRPIAEERARAARLASDGLRVEGTIAAWAKHPGGDESSPSMRLRVSYRVDQIAHESDLVATIDRGLLTDFAPGKSIHLLVDPADSSQIAIDRERSPMEVPRSW